MSLAEGAGLEQRALRCLWGEAALSEGRGQVGLCEAEGRPRLPARPGPLRPRGLPPPMAASLLGDAATGPQPPADLTGLLNLAVLA